MEPVSRFFAQYHVRLLISLAIVGGSLGVGWILRRVLYRIVRQWTEGKHAHLQVILIDSFRAPLLIWFLILGIDLSVRFSEIPTKVADKIEVVLTVLWIVSFTLMLSQLAGNWVRFYGSRFAGDLPVTSLSKNMAQIGVLLIGALSILHFLNVSVTPLLTALGVGGLAVALALQDTLSNLFGGFYITVAGQIRLGDYIKLNTGEEGAIADISWRSTTLRSGNNNLIIIPNSSMAKAVITNFNLPEKRTTAALVVGVSYDSEPEKIEALLLEIAQQAATEVPEILADPAAGVTLIPGFGDSALEFTLTCHITEFSQQGHVQHELRKRILKRFRQEKIDMPYKTQTVLLRRGEA